MAATPNDKKKVMDVAKPGKSAPSATTRPLIVSHSGTFIDPTASTDVKSAPVPSSDSMNGASGVTAAKPRGPKVLQPLSAKSSETTKDDVTSPIEQKDEVQSEDAAGETESTKTKQSAGLVVVDSSASTDADKATETDTDTDSSDTTDSSSEQDEDSKGSVDAQETPDTTPAEDDDENADQESKDSTDSENAAVVDAVVDQANIGKKQKEEDKEVVARKELVSKLVEEKKYFAPIKQKNTTRSGRMTMALSILGLLAVLGGYAAVDAGMINPGFDVPFHFLKKKEVATAVTTPAATPVSNTTPTAQPATPPASPTTIDYVNKELGVSFSYPSTWGDVAVKKQPGSITGNSVTFTFSKQPLLAAGMLSRDYKENGRDGVCYLLLGILPPSTLGTISGYVKEGDLVLDTQSLYKGTTRILKKTGDTLIYEQFETGPSANTEACLGLSTVGYVAFKSSAPYTGIQFYWGGDASTRKVVPVSELATYKTDPNKYLDNATRQSFVSMVESAKSQ